VLPGAYFGGKIIRSDSLRSPRLQGGYQKRTTFRWQVLITYLEYSKTFYIFAFYYKIKTLWCTGNKPHYIMSTLTKSMVRGFGWTIGKSAANSLLKADYSNTKLLGFSAKEQWISIGIWFILLFPIGFLFHSNAGALWFLLGWIPSIGIMVYFNRQKQKKIRLQIIPLIDELLVEIKALPLKLDIEMNIDWETEKYDGTISSLFNIYNTLTNLKLTVTFLLVKYEHNTDLVNKILKKEVWIDMTTDILEDMYGKPTSIEKSFTFTKANENVLTYVYGNKQTGNRFIFVNNLLTNYTIKK
jgi:hypothetical protein